MPSEPRPGRGPLSPICIGLTLAAGLTVGTYSDEAHAFSPFIGEIRAMGETFCPRGWANADGQLLPINQNTALFSIYGTTYGGDGETTFGLPDLRGRSTVHVGSGPGLPTVTLGQKHGSVSFTLNATQMPSHTHLASMRGHEEQGNQDAPDGHVVAGSQEDVYSDAAPDATLAAAAVTVANTGGSQAVSKRSPYQAVRWCVALFGVFPSRS